MRRVKTGFEPFCRFSAEKVKVYIRGWINCITQGNLRLLESCRREPASGSFGKLAPDSDRSIRDVCISAITLASRAAIQGGVHPELAFSLCDAYIMKIEQLKDLMDTQAVVEGAQTRFAMMVPFNEPLRHQALRAAGSRPYDGWAQYFCAQKPYRAENGVTNTASSRGK